MNKKLKIADWARMFFDIEQVKKRVLLGEKPAHWRNLDEEDKLKLSEATAERVKRCSEGFTDNDCHLQINWHEITDLEAYGIERPTPNM